MTADPVQGGVGIDQIERALRPPRGDVSLDPVATPPLRLALASISPELSMPMTVAAGQRSTRRRVELPGPQPRSATHSASGRGTRARRSIAGRVR